MPYLQNALKFDISMFTWVLLSLGRNSLLLFGTPLKAVALSRVWTGVPGMGAVVGGCQVSSERHPGLPRQQGQRSAVKSFGNGHLFFSGSTHWGSLTHPGDGCLTEPPLRLCHLQH